MPRKEQTPSEAFFTEWVAHLLCLTASNCQTDHAAISGSNSCCRKGEPLDSFATAAGSLPGRVCRTGTAIACACSTFGALAVRASADPTLGTLAPRACAATGTALLCFTLSLAAGSRLTAFAIALTWAAGLATATLWCAMVARAVWAGTVTRPHCALSGLTNIAKGQPTCQTQQRCGRS
jgi:hypothetical protein